MQLIKGELFSVVTFMAPKDPVPAVNDEISFSCAAAALEFEDANLRGEINLIVNNIIKSTFDPSML